MEIDTLYSNINDYFVSLVNNFEKNKLILTIGMGKSWVFNSNKNITCEVVGETTEGILINLFGTENDVNFSDLFLFANILIKKNLIIEEKEKEYKEKLKIETEILKKKIEEEKEKLKIETEKMYESLEKIKNDSFEENDIDLEEKMNSNNEENKMKEKLERN